MQSTSSHVHNRGIIFIEVFCIIFSSITIIFIFNFFNILQLSNLNSKLAFIPHIENQQLKINQFYQLELLSILKSKYSPPTLTTIIDPSTQNDSETLYTENWKIGENDFFAKFYYNNKLQKPTYIGVSIVIPLSSNTTNISLGDYTQKYFNYGTAQICGMKKGVIGACSFLRKPSSHNNAGIIYGITITPLTEQNSVLITSCQIEKSSKFYTKTSCL